MAMLKKHKDLLDKNRLFLVREIKLTEDFYAYLQQENIVTLEMAEEIKVFLNDNCLFISLSFFNCYSNNSIHSRIQILSYLTSI